MNQKLKKHFIKSMAVLFSAAVFLTTASPYTSYAKPPKKRPCCETEINVSKKLSTAYTQAETDNKSQIDLDKQFLECAKNGNIKECEKLLNQGANVNATYNTPIRFSLVSPGACKIYIFEATPLHLVACNGNTDMCKLFLSRKDININAKCNSLTETSMTPLHIAACTGNTEICKLLIENNADFKAKTNTGWTAINYAAYYEHLKTLKYLKSVTIHYLELKPRQTTNK